MNLTQKQIVEIQSQDPLTGALLQVANGIIEATGSLVKVSAVGKNLQKPAMFRRGLSRKDAADYIGVSTTKFDQLVSDKHMPRPKAIGGRRIWCVYEIDEHFDQLGAPHQAISTNSWDEVQP